MKTNEILETVVSEINEKMFKLCGMPIVHSYFMNEEYGLKLDLPEQVIHDEITLCRDPYYLKISNKPIEDKDAMYKAIYKKAKKNKDNIYEFINPENEDTDVCLSRIIKILEGEM